MEIDGASALVTGAGSGLGAATAARLAGRGARVIGLDRDAAAVDAALRDLPGARACRGDITDTHNVSAAVETAASVGPLRIVVNCAGGGLPPALVLARDGQAHPLEPWRGVVELNLVAAFDVMRQAAAAMARAPALEGGARGVIVHTASIAGLDGSQGSTPYVASKGALAPLVHAAARDLSVWGIRVVAIAPGTFATPLYGRLPDTIRARRESDVVFPKRVGRPDEYAAFVEHVVENDYLNADCYRLDAGLRIHGR